MAFFDIAEAMGLTGVGHHSLQQLVFVVAHLVRSEKRAFLKGTIGVSLCAGAKGLVLGVSFVAVDYGLTPPLLGFAFWSSASQPNLRV